jgi:hypothetical protein
MPVLFQDLGTFKKLPDESGTFSLDRDKWLHAFGDGELPEGETLVKKRVYSAGLYCFLWKGSVDELNALSTTHYVKGKVTSSDDPRLADTQIEVRPEDENETQYAYHPIDWKFNQVVIDKENYVPLYIGKSSKIYNRIASHLQWPSSLDSPPLANEFGLPAALKPDGNTVAQFRQGFEYLFRSLSPVDRRDKLRKNIALAICPSDFANVYNRFYDEDLLIGTFRPPFNVDSER